jgi:hypothetical protein
MREIWTSGSMSGIGNGASPHGRAHPRLYPSVSVGMSALPPLSEGAPVILRITFSPR